MIVVESPTHLRPGRAMLRLTGGTLMSGERGMCVCIFMCMERPQNKYHYLVKSYRFTLIKCNKLVCLEKTFPAIPTLPWFAIVLAHMRVSLTKQQGRAAHYTQKSCTTHKAKGRLGSGLCYCHKEGCAMWAYEFLGPEGPSISP